MAGVLGHTHQPPQLLMCFAIYGKEELTNQSCIDDSKHVNLAIFHNVDEIIYKIRSTNQFR
jgi:hypothetical protein